MTPLFIHTYSSPCSSVSSSSLSNSGSMYSPISFLSHICQGVAIIDLVAHGGLACVFSSRVRFCEFLVCLCGPSLGFVLFVRRIPSNMLGVVVTICWCQWGSAVEVLSFLSGSFF
jgi:hypothetical protein